MLVHNRKISVAEMCDCIDRVDGPTIKRVANRFFGSQSGNKPTILAMSPEEISQNDCNEV